MPYGGKDTQCNVTQIDKININSRKYSDFGWFYIFKYNFKTW